MKDADAVHLGRFDDLSESDQGQALMVSATSAALRSLTRREQLGIPEHAYWPTCAVFVSIAEASALLNAVPEHRWPESTRALRRELQLLVREGERTRP